MLTALPTASIIRAALWGFGQLFPFSEFFDNPGKSLIQSAKYLLSGFRIGRYQCPPRKEPQDTRFATSPTRHRVAGCERSVRAVRFPETQVSIVSIALRDQLIHNILVWRAVQRESLTRQGSKAGKIRVRTGRESDRLRWEPEEKRLCDEARLTSCAYVFKARVYSLWALKHLKMHTCKSRKSTFSTNLHWTTVFIKTCIRPCVPVLMFLCYSLKKSNIKTVNVLLLASGIHLRNLKPIFKWYYWRSLICS